ncbi:alpha/beta fold hydrolase [Streptomyces sp. Ag109_G2-15]|nr:hypothetical protein [Streptomyces sp. Ag109_G2-15]
MTSRRPSTQLNVIPNAGHDVHLDSPKELYEAIAAFVPAST